MLPRNMTKWLIEQPDSALSTKSAHFEVLEARYNFTHPYVVQFPYHEEIIRKTLPRRLGALTMDIWEEVTHTTDEQLGLDTENWKEICVYEATTHMIAQISNRLFVGSELCREKQLMTHNVAFANAIGMNLLLLGMLPAALKPLVGPLLAMRNNYHWRKTQNWTLPVIRQRLADIQRKIKEPQFEFEDPDDYLSWHIRMAIADGQTGELDPELISRRLMTLNFAAIHTTSMTFTMLFFDLVAANPKLGFIEALQEESARVFKEEGGVWSKLALQRCIRLDSAIRESMRVSTFMARALTRKVVVPGGIQVPGQSAAWTMPQGAYVSVDSWSVQHDPEIYPNPYQFDAFRFSRMREEGAEEMKVEENGAPVAAGDEKNKTEEILKMKNLGMITTSDVFLSFGHGKHAWYVFLHSAAFFLGC